MAEMRTGTVVRLNAEKGFGFIRPAERDSPDVFFHCSRLSEALEFGEHLLERRVKYLVGIGERGPHARTVEPL